MPNVRRKGFGGRNFTHDPAVKQSPRVCVQGEHMKVVPAILVFLSTEVLRL